LTRKFNDAIVNFSSAFAIVKAELKWIEVALLQEYLFGCLSSKRRRGKGKNAEGHPALNRYAPGRRLKKSATVIERWRAI